tara:strand:- start:116 stop:415 length:300 start_codon:yes stop_codon:yes gene_type:complete
MEKKNNNKIGYKKLESCVVAIAIITLSVTHLALAAERRKRCGRFHFGVIDGKIEAISASGALPHLRRNTTLIQVVNEQRVGGVVEHPNRSVVDRKSVAV